MRQATSWAVGALVLGLCSFTANAADDDKAWQNLPPDAQAALREHWEGMTPEEQGEYVQNAKDRRAKFESLSPDKQAAINERREQRRQEWAGMSEEERRASMADSRQRKADVQARWEGMSDEERDAWQQNRGERNQAIRDKTPEEREQLKERLEKRKQGN